MRRAPGRSVRRTIAWGCAIIVAACGSDRTLVDPDGDDREGIVIRVLAKDAALATSLGWEAGIPGAAVHVRQDATPDILTFRTDSTGQVITDLPTAKYWVWVERRLNDAERGRAGGNVQVLGGGMVSGLERGIEATVSLRADDPGSLVISEYHYHWASTSVIGLPGYSGYWYIELYNNGATTVYLDGKIIGSGFNYNIDAPLWTCTETEPFRNEPRGVYAQYFQAFPGTGTQYPVAPGQAVVIADQAIDHSAFYPSVPDLREADFEFPFTDRANNPAVPDLVDVGLKPITGNRPWRFLSLFDVPFIAEPVNIASLQRVLPKYQGEVALFPTDAIIDIAAFTSQFYTVPRPTPLCGTQVHPSLDQVSGVLPPDEETPDRHLVSVHRKRLPNGKLQRTHATYVDFELAPRSPGHVP